MTELQAVDPANDSAKLVDAFYRIPDVNLLSQGDLLSCPLLAKCLIPPIHSEGVASDVYPYFFGKYGHAVILNANCDIVRGRTKVRCIQIAAVVEAESYVKKLILNVSDKVHHETMLIDTTTREAVARQLLSLFNQQEKRYFYLPRNPAIGFKSHKLIRLDTSVSIQIDRKGMYEAILDARLPASLKDPYPSKLGEKFADLYARTGTDDVQDHLGSDFGEWLANQLANYFMGVPPVLYYRCINEVKELAKTVKPGSPGYADALAKIIEKHSKDEVHEFEHLPVFRALRKIVTDNFKNGADSLLVKICKEPGIRKAFDTLTLVDADNKDENDSLDMPD